MKGGILLTVGFLPGLKARIIPLLFRNKVNSYLQLKWQLDFYFL